MHRLSISSNSATPGIHVQPVAAEVQADEVILSFNRSSHRYAGNVQHLRLAIYGSEAAGVEVAHTNRRRLMNAALELIGDITSCMNEASANPVVALAPGYQAVRDALEVCLQSANDSFATMDARKMEYAESGG